MVLRFARGESRPDADSVRECAGGAVGSVPPVDRPPRTCRGSREMSENGSSLAPLAEFRAVTKWYGPVIGVNDLRFELTSGITGLLGPNGAGKTTLIKLL